MKREKDLKPNRFYQECKPYILPTDYSKGMELMKTNQAKKFTQKLLAVAGVEVNGNQPWDMQVHDDAAFAKIISGGSIGLGETYVNGQWDCERVDQFIAKVLRADLHHHLKANVSLLASYLWHKLYNHQSKKGALEVGVKHYDVGNHLYQTMLDSRMNYSCGYWAGTEQLEEAQLNKLILCCQKLNLQPGMRILDIGCGFGGFARYAAEHYGVEVLGVTISQQQYLYAKEVCAGLPIEIRFQDYRDVTGQFDRIISIGMFEHVGYLNYRHYMQIVHERLTDDGIFLLHTMGSNSNQVAGDPWLNKYVLPNGMLPSIEQMGSAIDQLLVMEDWHNFGADYDKTLMAWHQRFNQAWPTLQKDYDANFFRMWNYYLLCFAGSFRAREIQLWQLVLSKNGVLGGYHAPHHHFQRE